jgi:hypothetical protein
MRCVNKLFIIHVNYTLLSFLQDASVLSLTLPVAELQMLLYWHTVHK